MRHDHPFITAGTPLTPRDAVVAIVCVGDRYLLQHRDSKPEIFFPDHWGFFGGAIEDGETPEECLLREFAEETNLVADKDDLTFFTELTFDFRFADGTIILRSFFELTIDPALVEKIVLREGQDFGLFTTEEALADLRLAPYDSFALWAHARRQRFIF